MASRSGDPDVAADQQFIEDLRAGAEPPTEDQVAAGLAAMRAAADGPPVSGWLEDPTEPSGWRWVPDLSTLDPAVAGRALPGGPVDYAGHRDWPGLALDARVDGWCEDRPPDQLSDDDGRD